MAKGRLRNRMKANRAERKDGRTLKKDGKRARKQAKRDDKHSKKLEKKAQRQAVRMEKQRTKQIKQEQKAMAKIGKAEAKSAGKSSEGGGDFWQNLAGGIGGAVGGLSEGDGVLGNMVGGALDSFGFGGGGSDTISESFDVPSVQKSSMIETNQIGEQMIPEVTVGASASDYSKGYWDKNDKWIPFNFFDRILLQIGALKPQR